MKKVFISAIAGLSRRFNKGAAKAVYYEKNPLDTLLYEQCVKARRCDKIIIVGGYQFENVTRYVRKYLTPRFKNITILFNPRFDRYGSGYSLYLALKEAEKDGANEIIFCEGDLFFDSKSFSKVITAKNDALAISAMPIEASKAVVLYEDCRHIYKYIYDTGHKALLIPEPFLAIYNSAQIWKFRDTERLFFLLRSLPESCFTGTNLELINAYFACLHADYVSRVDIQSWINCNTIDDYQQILKKLNRKNGNKTGETL
ncbi:MAG: hypothetical protein LBC77_00785 [Spirochaetaceae bacterium]|jgi:CTP:phosphocholine cytidylyltransferase-like protein|nr:hypothetical protein [Spirochaetaceae bacterium]